MYNPVNTVISFVLMIAIVGGSFYYVYALTPRGPWTGITNGWLYPPEAAEVLGLDEDHGYLIFTIAPSSPADRAGLQQANDVVVIRGERIPIGGDIVVGVDGRQIDEICDVLEQKQVGNSLKLVVNRDGNLREVNLVLEEAPPGQSSLC